MGTIQSSVGLITGVPIKDTVDQLMAISAQPRNRLQSRTAAIQQEQVAITELTALVVGLELSSAGFGREELYDTTAVTSSNSDAVSVTQTNPSVNVQNQQIRVRQLAQTNAFASRSLGSSTESLGYSGRLNIETGGFIDNSIALDDLNGGRGVQRGTIRLTDRAGHVADIDLSSATTIDDVLTAINDASGVEIRATTSGDAIVLTDRTGQTLSNLKVSEVGGGTTAADLGLRSINAAADSATGLDIFSLAASTTLASLRDGRGLGLASGTDINVTLRDGTEIEIDFSDFSREARNASGTTNASDPNAVVTIDTVDVGGEYDGMEIVFVDDAAVSAGSETVQLLEGSFGKQLVFHIDQGNTTAGNIADALAADAELSELFTATAGGDGSGVVATDDVATVTGGAAIDKQSEPTIEDLLRMFNDASPKLQAAISASGDAIELHDLSGGAGSLIIADAGESTVASDLGLHGTFGADSVTGTRLQSGLQSVSLDSLAGGVGLGGLTSLSITTRDGQSANVDLSSASSIADVIHAINDSGLDVEAGYNDQGTGIAVRDLSGGTDNHFVIASLDETAQKLGLAINTSDTLATGDNLRAQYVSRNTRLADLNQGQGISDGSFTVVDRSGQSGTVNVASLLTKTVGGLIDRINSLGIGVQASLNSDGNGIEIVDVTGGEGRLSITDRIGGTAAAELGIAGTSQSRVIDGEVKEVIVGSQGISINVTADDTSATIAAKVQEAGKFASANVSGGRLELLSKRGGEAGRLAVSTVGFDIGLRQTSEAQDAAIEVGQGASATVHRSSDNVFDDVIAGLSFTAKQVSDDPVAISVRKDNHAVASRVKTFVDAYNRLVDRLDDLTVFDEATQSVGLLFGSGEVLRIQSQLGNLLTGRISGAGEIKSLAEVGLRLTETGKMNFDAAKLNEKLDSDPEAVKTFFTSETTGVSARLKKSVDSLAGINNSVLLNRNRSLQERIDTNNQRIASYNTRLEKEESRLLAQFYAMEQAIAKLQSNQQFLGNITLITANDGR
ncbi:MAG: flagellar filament capping protein FliD [Pirellulaceae bacterium]